MYFLKAVFSSGNYRYLGVPIFLLMEELDGECMIPWLILTVLLAAIVFEGVWKLSVCALFGFKKMFDIFLLQFTVSLKLENIY